MNLKKKIKQGYLLQSNVLRVYKGVINMQVHILQFTVSQLTRVRKAQGSGIKETHYNPTVFLSSSETREETFTSLSFIFFISKMRLLLSLS